MPLADCTASVGRFSARVHVHIYTRARHTRTRTRAHVWVVTTCATPQDVRAIRVDQLTRTEKLAFQSPHQQLSLEQTRAVPRQLTSFAFKCYDMSLPPRLCTVTHLELNSCRSLVDLSHLCGCEHLKVCTIRDAKVTTSPRQCVFYLSPLPAVQGASARRTGVYYTHLVDTRLPRLSGLCQPGVGWVRGGGYFLTAQL